MTKQVSEIKPKKLPRKSEFINWYNNLLRLAEIADKRYPVKGTFAWLPYGIQIMRNIKEYWDILFKEYGIKEIYVPLFVSKKNAKANKEWFKSFRDHVYLTSLPGKRDQYILRPTGEPAIYPMFKLWVKDFGLPIRVYQTVSSFRYEGRTTHVLIRDREVTFWYEIHTAHKTREEAEEEVNRHLEIVKKIWKFLAIPAVVVKKPPYEIFPGALGAIEAYTILPDGRLLENGSINNLAQAYSKIYDVYHTDEKGEKRYVWQICTGNGARYLAAVVALHGDDRGLCLPPTIAPVQCIIIPISIKSKEIINQCLKLKDRLQRNGIRAEVDLEEDITPGEKFYKWEIKGVPLRIEIGQRERKNKRLTVFRRDLLERNIVPITNVINYVENQIRDMETTLEKKIQTFFDSKIRQFDSLERAVSWVREGGVAKVSWCEEKYCYGKICEMEKGIEPIGTLLETAKNGQCIICKKETAKLTLIGNTY